VVVLYAGAPEAAATAHLPLPALRAAGADGRDMPISDGAVSLADGMAYVWLNAAASAAHLKTDTTAARLYAIGRQPSAQPRLASPVVIQFL
ncbi:glycosyl hydrolase, partial [Staphylococcus aureus]|nr:glycosyl hydrolase [Staphylococcus aureus]